MSSDRPAISPAAISKDMGVSSTRVRVGGSEVEIRLARLEDADALTGLYEGLSNDDTVHRFFSGSPPIRRLVDRWLTAEDPRERRLVAIRDDGSAVADAGFLPLTDGYWVGDAEFDLTVSARARGWFGSFLLDCLVDEARVVGIRNLHASILRDNHAMVAIATRRGYVVVDHEVPTEFHIAIGVREDMPVWPDRDDRIRVVVESRALEWHGTASARSFGMTAVVCPGPVTGPRPRCRAAEGEPCPLAAAADVIVHSLPEADDRARQVFLAHGHLHPHARVMLEELSTEHRSRPDGVGRLERQDPQVAEQILRGLGKDPVLPKRRPL